MKAIIGGTGIDEIDQFNKKAELIETKYGNVSFTEKDGIIFLSRHGVGHTLPPHKVNYKANVEALKRLNVDEAVGIYAVGSITDKVPMKGFGVLSDYMDFSGRSITFYDEEVKHTSVSNPYDKKLSLRLKKALGNVSDNVVYVNTNGPRFETKAEIKAYDILGGDVVGMTGGTETTLMNEMGISYGAIVYSINWACGIFDEITFSTDEEIMAMSNKALNAALEALS